MKAIIYARFSPRPNASECESCTRQIEDCRAWCKQNGHEVVAEFADEGMSGASIERPGLWSAVDALKPGYLLVVRSIDRLARDVLIHETILKAVEKEKAQLATVESGEVDNTPTGVFIRQILAAFAEMQRKMINARTKVRMLQHQANGRAMSKLPPYGFRNEDGVLVEDDYEQRVIKEVLFLNEAGTSLRGIAAHLEGKYDSRNGSWSHTTVASILKRAQAS